MAVASKVTRFTPQIAWIDFETNGVPEEVPVVMPFEVGMIVTDKAGNEISSFQSLILHPGWENQLKKANPYVQQMHEKSGLAEDLAKLASTGVEAYRTHCHWAVEAKIVEWLDSIPFQSDPTGKVKRLPMTGSTVHFDRAVTISWMPKLNSWFHYRNQDVSSLKNFCKLLNPSLYDRMPKDSKKVHRPLDDIRNSIREYQWYMENFLFVEEDRRW